MNLKERYDYIKFRAKEMEKERRRKIKEESMQLLDRLEQVKRDNVLTENISLKLRGNKYEF